MNKKIFFSLSVLILIAAFFRFFHLSDYLYFTIDEERDAFIMQKIITTKQPTLIGPAVPKLTYLGPFYFNFSAFILSLTNLDLIKMGIVASFIGIINVVLLFFCVKSFFNFKLAFLSGLIYSVSFLIAIYNRTYWPLAYTQFSVIATYFCLFKIIKGERRYMLFLAIPLIIGVQSEPTTFSLIPLVMVVLFLNKIREFKKIVALFCILIFSHISLIVFDFRHNHFLSNMLISFFAGGSRKVVPNFFSLIQSVEIAFLAFVRTFHIFGPPDVSLQIAPISKYMDFRFKNIPLLFSIISFAALMYFLKKAQADKKLQIISYHVLIVIVGISFYNFFFPGYTFEWFINCLFPAFSIIWAYIVLNIFRNKFMQYLIILCILILNFKSVIFGGNSFSLKSKIEAVEWASAQVKNKNFELLSIGGWSQGGYRFLFDRYGVKPAKSYQDGIFAGWMYPKNDINIQKKVIFVSELEFKDKKLLKEYFNYKKQSKSHNKFGNIEVLII